jgi:hypothetical protein
MSKATGTAGKKTMAGKAKIEQVVPGHFRKQEELETEIAQLKAENAALRLQVAQAQQQIPNEPDPDSKEWQGEYCCICKLAHLGKSMALDRP